MVYGVIIASMTTLQDVFSHFEDPEAHDTRRGARQAMIVRHVSDDHAFQVQCIAEAQTQRHDANPQHDEGTAASHHQRESDFFWRILAEHGKKAGNSGGQETLEMTEGVVEVPASSLLRTPKALIWQQVDTIAYIFVCELEENLSLAQNALTLFIGYLVEHFKTSGAMKGSLTAGNLVNQYVERPDEVLAFIRFLLPGGRLQLLNITAARATKAHVKTFLAQT